jgi:hypothetical protein
MEVRPTAPKRNPIAASTEACGSSSQALDGIEAECPAVAPGGAGRASSNRRRRSRVWPCSRLSLYMHHVCTDYSP